MARWFRAREDAVCWAEKTHLGKMGRDPEFKGSGEKCLSMEATAAGKQKEGEVASMALSMQRRAQ